MTTSTWDRRSEQAQEPATPRTAAMFVPFVDIIERPEEWLLIADIPGATAQNIDVDFDRGTLWVRASVQDRSPSEGVCFLHREYGVGDFERSFEVGEGINADSMKAEYREGVLTLHLPKAETAKTRKIAVKTG